MIHLTLSFTTSLKLKLTTAKDKATAVAKKLTKNVTKKGTRIHTKVHFYRPKTLSLPRNPKYPTKSIPAKNALDKKSVLKYPLNTESSMKMIEDSNTLVFIADIRANKRQIKAALKEAQAVEIERVNTLITPRGLKKAYIKLTKDHDALDVANRMGII
jgi:large subunit ribosomal protein L23Ae